MFQSNQPVSGLAFHDRAAELGRLQTLADDLRKGSPRWLAIIGPRKIGKTSLILELSRRAGEVAIVPVDTQEVSPLSWEIFRLYALRAADVMLGKELQASLEVTAATGGDLDAVLDASGTLAALPASLR